MKNIVEISRSKSGNITKISYKDMSSADKCNICSCNVINRRGWQKKLAPKNITKWENTKVYIFRQRYRCEHYDCLKFFYACTIEDSINRFKKMMDEEGTNK